MFVGRNTDHCLDLTLRCIVLVILQQRIDHRVFAEQGSLAASLFMIFTQVGHIFRNFFCLSFFGKCIDSMQMMAEIMTDSTIVLHRLIYLFHMTDLYFHLLFHFLILLLQQFRLLCILKKPSPQYETAGKDHNDRRPLGKPAAVNRFKLRIQAVPHITTGVE